MGMGIGEYSEDDFYAMVEEGMEDAIDHVATQDEWEACKRAVARWLAKTDEAVRRGLDQAAVEAEHEEREGL